MSGAEAVALSTEEMEALRRRVETRQLLDSDFPLLMKILSTVQALARILEKKRASVARLRQMIFGTRSEKTDAVVGKSREGKGSKEKEQEKEKGKGHGRRGVQAYWGAQRVEVRHPELVVGQRCPDCDHGNLYDLKVPSKVLWFQAHAPIQATAFECQRLRCSGCGNVFPAAPPPEARIRKYDESVGSMIAVLRYGSGMPHNRLAQLQRSVGIPLSPSVQWELVKQKAESCGALIYMVLLRHAAQGDLMRVDDTMMRILREELRRSGLRDMLDWNEQSPSVGNKGTRTTAIVSTAGDHQIVVYITGKRYAGQNMDQLLSLRDEQNPPPIQMCDALTQNLPKQFEVILANCNSHYPEKSVIWSRDTISLRPLAEMR